MEIAALVVAVLALIVALVARSAALGLEKRIEDGQDDARRRVENAQAASEREIETLRKMLAKVARGDKVDEDMILEGRMWREAGTREAVELVSGGKVRIVDVRTPQETASGIIPGALLIPVDQLEARAGEIARDGLTTLVYCAGGSRSAAACEFLSTQGHENLINLSGGFGAWNGPRAKPG